MKRARFALTLSGIAVAIAGCSGRSEQEAGPMGAKTVAVGDFKKIESAGSYDITVKTGSAPSVRIEGPQNVIDNIVVEVEGDELQIHSKSGINLGWKNSGPVKIAVTVPQLNGASMAGSGTIAVDKVVADTFEAGIAGSGDLSLPSVSAKTVEVDIAGSGNVMLAGTAERASYDIAGSGSVDSAKLVTRDAKVGIAGSGTVNGHATGQVTGDVLGSGTATFTGGAKCSVDKMGSGSITCS